VAAAAPRARRRSLDRDRRRDAVLRRGACGRASGTCPSASGRRRAHRHRGIARQRPCHRPAFESVATARVRGRWTTDYAWHLTAELGLVAGVAWYVVGIGLATGRLVAFAAGAAPDGWSTPLVAAPLAVGWVIQVLIASWTHLLPSIGPGDPPAHARQRPVLGRGAVPRLLALNAGTALLALGWPTGSTHAAAAGLVLAATAVLSSVILGGLAIRESR
jgi:hypothetical protein